MLLGRSVTKDEKFMNVKEDEKNWTKEIISYIVDGHIPSDKSKAKKL